MKAIINYMGFYGQIRYGTSGIPTTVCWKLGDPGAPFSGGNGAIQWFHPLDGNVELLPKSPEGQLFLAGLIWDSTDSLFTLVENIANTLKSGSYKDLAMITENAVGAFISDGVLYLWTGFASNDHVFYRQTGPWTYWSTNPLDLVHDDDDLDTDALWRCCHGEDVFCYDQQIKRVEPGYLVELSLDRNRSSSIHRFDQFTADPRFLGRVALEGLAKANREAMREALCPLAECGEPVGIMLSSGVDSSALLTVMKEVGVNVIAYHLESPDLAGSERELAQRVCTALDIPLTTIMMSTGTDFISPHWVSPHPDGHPWMRRFEQIAQQAKADGIRLLVSGIGGDPAFGPEMEFGAHSILSARIAWREKILMLKGLLMSDWNIYDIIRSFRQSRQLIGLTHLAGPSKEDIEMRMAAFLTPKPSSVRTIDAALLHSPCFTPQGMSVEQTVLQPNGIRLYNPYHHRNIQAVSLAIPAAYRIIANPESLVPEIGSVPDLPRVVTKPVLRLSVRDTPLPPDILWRTWSVYTNSTAQKFCTEHPEVIREMLGIGSQLSRLNIIDPIRLEQVLANHQQTRNNYIPLLAACMVENFLRYSWQEQRKRGGPRWM